jgi:putative transposase
LPTARRDGGKGFPPYVASIPLADARARFYPALMPNYRRHYLPHPVFVTLVTHRRHPWMTGPALEIVKQSMHRAHALHPFRHFAHVLLPDHLHWLFALEHEANFSALVSTFKRDVAWRLKERGEVGPFWQARFHDHIIRDQDDLHRHLDYIHYNPVKHGRCERPLDYPHSSFHAWLERGHYTRDWGEAEPRHLTALDLERAAGNDSRPTSAPTS